MNSLSTASVRGAAAASGGAGPQRQPLQRLQADDEVCQQVGAVRGDVRRDAALTERPAFVASQVAHERVRVEAEVGLAVDDVSPGAARLPETDEGPLTRLVAGRLQVFEDFDPQLRGEPPQGAEVADVEGARWHA